MCPLLGEVPSPVHGTMESPPIVWPKPCEKDEEMRGNEDIDEIELQQSQLVDGTADMPGIDLCFGPGPIETLRGKCDSFCRS